MSRLIIGSDPLARNLTFKFNDMKNVNSVFYVSKNQNLHKLIKEMKTPRTVISTDNSPALVSRLCHAMDAGDSYVDFANEYHEDVKKKQMVYNNHSIEYISGAISNSSVIMSGSKKVFENNKEFFESSFNRCEFIDNNSDVCQFVDMTMNAMNDSFIQGIYDVFAYGGQDATTTIEFIESCKDTDIDGIILRNFKLYNNMKLDKRIREYTIRHSIPCPIICATNDYITLNTYKKYINTHTPQNKCYDAKVARNALRFLYASVIIEALNILQSRAIPIRAVMNFIKDESDLKCEMLSYNMDQLHTVLDECEHDARMFMMQSLGVSIPCPSIQAALNQHDLLNFFSVQGDEIII